VTKEPEPMHIILVEDDDGHAMLVEKNLRRAGLVNGYTRFKDGQEVVDGLLGPAGGTASRMTSTSVLLLDINMPKLDGIEVLRRLRADSRTATLPVIMLTTTDNPREIQKCYELGCNVYVTKPVEYDSFVDAIRRLGLFLQVVKLPAGIVPAKAE
jgi:CheY-like chemotaxis protein